MRSIRDRLSFRQRAAQREAEETTPARPLVTWMRWPTLVLSVGLALYQLYTARYGTPPALEHRAIHVGVMLAVTFLLYSWRGRRGSEGTETGLAGAALDSLFAAAALATAWYIAANYEALVYRAGMPETADLVMAGLLLVLVLEAGRRVMGAVLPGLAIVFLLYAGFGRFLGGLLSHRGFTLSEILEYMYLTTEGIFGVPVGTSAEYLILFIIFGAFLVKSGAGEFFTQLAVSVAGRWRGGPAQVAVISSAMVGSINGSAVANVVTTGTFTIPLMKRIGYSPEFAGAVEAAASTGGQLLPPVMGASAFIMAEILGRPYRDIVVAGVIPALLYYTAVFVMVYLRASRLGLAGMDPSTLPRFWDLMKRRGFLLLPLVALVYFLLAGYTPTYAGVYAILLSVVVSWLVPGSRMGPRQIIEALELGVRNAVSVAVACAVVGIIVGVATMTGLGTKVAGAILAVSGGRLLPTLVMTMFAAILLGVGVPSIPSYVLTATIAAPALVQLGVAPLVAHFFVFYFAMMANLTPPVALAAFAACGISGGDITRTGLQAFKLASAGFLIPYMFVNEPVLLLQDTNTLEAIGMVFTALVGIVALAAAVEGYFLGVAHWWQRLFLLGSAVTLVDPGLVTDAIGLILLIPVVISQLLEGRRHVLQQTSAGRG